MSTKAQQNKSASKNKYKISNPLDATIKEISDNGLTVLLVEQNVTQSLSIADRAYVIEEGSIAISGLSKDLLKNADLKKSYLGL